MKLRRTDNATYQEIRRLLSKIEKMPELGYPLLDEWQGCRAMHCGRDRYRIIWKVLEPIEDYEGLADQVVLIWVLRIGPKTDRRGRTIYDRELPSGP